MAEKINLGAGTEDSSKSGGSQGQNTKNSLRGTEVPKSVIVVVIVLIIAALGAGIYYTVNGGWKTRAMQLSDYKHNGAPLWLAAHGDMSAFNEENARRKRLGIPLLTLSHRAPVNTQAEVQKLRQLLISKQKAGSTP